MLWPSLETIHSFLPAVETRHLRVAAHDDDAAGGGEVVAGLGLLQVLPLLPIYLAKQQVAPSEGRLRLRRRCQGKHGEQKTLPVR